jgi:D-tyrosyl-tRNA(Tyr) deacylase
MRAVIQRVSKASCAVDGVITGSIQKGLLILLGVEASDTESDVVWLSQKIWNMRIFGDEDDQMNLSIGDVGGELLVISQFTLFAITKKGNRPSFVRAARPEHAIPLYEFFKTQLEKLSSKTVRSGIFGADMKIELINDGPVTIIMDTHDRDNH